MTTPVRTQLRRHILESAWLAFPVMVARSGGLIMIAVDVIMTGRAGSEQLAFYGLGLAPAQNMLMIGHGILLGAMVLTAQALGRGRHADCATIWYVSMAHGFGLGLVFLLLGSQGEWLLGLAGQSPELAAGGGGVMTMFAWGLPGLMLYVATSQFMEGLSRPKPNMVLMVLANLFNFALNWLLIYDHPPGGWLGFSGAGMGAEGAALATTITRWLMWLGLAGYVVFMPGARRLGIGRAARAARKASGKLLRLGLPVGLANGLESGAFTTIVLFAGLLGTAQMAAFQIVQNLFVNAYMLAIGMATATGVRVGNAVGRRDRVGVAWAGWTGICMAFVFFLIVMAVFLALPEFLSGLYSSDTQVLRLAASGLAVAALFIVLDALQGVATGALRGAGAVWAPTVMVNFGFWGISVPLGYTAAFVMDWRLEGLLWGLTAGALVATVLLVTWFAVVSRRDIAPL